MKLIITADDYGMSEGVNRGIEACIENNTVTSTNVMVNMPCCDEAKFLKEKYPDISVGLHWTISCGKPVSKLSEIPSLVDENGDFFAPTEFVNRMKHKKINITELRKELVAQYKKYVDICGEPDYWNTHQNTHVNLYAFKTFFEVANELGIKTMRFHKKVWIKSKAKNGLNLRFIVSETAKYVVLTYWKLKLKLNGVKSPCGVTTFINKEEVYGDMDFKERTLRSKNAELVIHPASEIDSKYLGKLTDKRISEYEKFSAPEMTEYLNKNFEVVSFSGI